MEKLLNIAQTILHHAKALGAQSAACTVSETETHEFNVDGGEFSLLRTLFDHTVSLTVFKDHRKGIVMINRFDEDSIHSAVEDCIAAAESASPDEHWEIEHTPVVREFHQGTFTPDTQLLFQRLEELLTDVKTRHPKLLMEQLIADHIGSRSVYMNSYGTTYKTVSGRYNFSLMYSAHEGESSSSFYGSDVTLEQLDRPIIDCAMIEQEFSDIEKQIHTSSPNGKFTGTVVFTPQCLAQTVLANILENFAGDSALLNDTSIWKDRLGQPVADPRVHLSLRPHDPRIVCGQRYTGEGYLAEDCDIIKDGRLENFYLSQYVANKTGNRRAPNTSFSLVMDPGDTPLSDIIAGIDKGILVGRFSGGEPGANGEFSGVAKNGFLIENGRITSALSETMISGNLADMLNHLRAISRETLEDGTLCLPYMAFDGITISGK